MVVSPIIHPGDSTCRARGKLRRESVGAQRYPVLGAGVIVVAGERSIRSEQYAGSGYAVVQRRSDSRNCAPRGGNFRCQLGNISCLRQRKPGRQTARLRVWWWLLPVRRVWKRTLFAAEFGSIAPFDHASAQARSKKAVNNETAPPRGAIRSRVSVSFCKKAFERVGRALRIDPRAVLFVDIEHRRFVTRLLI